MGMIDEQRLRARIAALRLAFPDTPTASEEDGRFDLARQYEEWIMRPSPTDAGAPKVDVRVRQPCGAFEQPAWYVGAMWLTCSGRHRPEDGWHLAGDASSEIIFHSHHATDHAGPERCACGGTELPCPDADPMDMTA